MIEIPTAILLVDAFDEGLDVKVEATLFADHVHFSGPGGTLDLPWEVVRQLAERPEADEAWQTP